jgi:hypothetical protein
MPTAGISTSHIIVFPNSIAMLEEFDHNSQATIAIIASTAPYIGKIPWQIMYISRYTSQATHAALAQRGPKAIWTTDMVLLPNNGLNFAGLRG